MLYKTFQRLEDDVTKLPLLAVYAPHTPRIWQEIIAKQKECVQWTSEKLYTDSELFGSYLFRRSWSGSHLLNFMETR